MTFLLASACGWTLGAVITKLRTFRNIEFSTFTKLYDTGVIPVMNYASAFGNTKNTPRPHIYICEKVTWVVNTYNQEAI